MMSSKSILLLILAFWGIAVCLQTLPLFKRPRQDRSPCTVPRRIHSSELELATCRLALRDIGSKPRHSDDERSTTASTATLLTMLDFCTLHCTRHFCATRAKGIFLKFSERLMARPSGTASSQSHVEAVRYQVHLKLSCSYSDVSTARSYPGNHSNGFTT